ncbi:hypothetical protein GNI_178850 [Gregarina niphandrodes]|uniref:Uncharacterized protein n=1 Tax=Gregarina niphandrodes TaxID=110365 RepID=A0A023AYA9_GRENI|nr:hypothetical protein GNI_178850 [Gregarina niphandrodes]EZG43270.1 hypothetical protein GNI_178850 [Gregarina niphandrodes]|eukprot:XP_011133472.1 hypothetical protein GNI_178850 [Gregarina niphandrodes]
MSESVSTVHSLSVRVRSSCALSRGDFLFPTPKMLVVSAGRRSFSLWPCVVLSVSEGSPAGGDSSDASGPTSQVALDCWTGGDPPDGWDWSRVSGNDYESYWINRFEVPLDKEGFDFLRLRVSSKALCRRKEWVLRGPLLAATVNKPGYDAESWSLVEAGSIRPSYIPVLPRRRAANIPVQATGMQTDFGAYRALHGTLSRQAWGRLRTIEPKVFEKCALAYVELGAIISRYFESPYGLVDFRVKAWVRATMQCRRPRPRRVRHWILGCLLQHSGASLQQLGEFCVKNLAYNPSAPLSSRRVLLCLRSQPKMSSRQRSPELRLRLLEQILHGLPEVSVRKFGTLTQRALNEALQPGFRKNTPCSGKKFLARRTGSLSPVPEILTTSGTLTSHQPLTEVRMAATESMTEGFAWDGVSDVGHIWSHTQHNTDEQRARKRKISHDEGNWSWAEGGGPSTALVNEGHVVNESVMNADAETFWKEYGATFQWG